MSKKNAKTALVMPGAMSGERLEQFINMTKRNRRHEDKRAKGRKYACRKKVDY